MSITDKDKHCAAMFSSFRAILREYNAFLTNAVSDYRLSPNEIVVLSSLQNVSNAGQIAKESDVSKALVSRSVKLLRGKRLIEVTISAVDKREQDLRLTEEGAKVAERIAAANRAFGEEALHNVDFEAVEMMKLLLRLVLRNLGVEDIKDIDDGGR